MVMVEAPSPLMAPGVHVTPASVLGTLQLRVTLCTFKPKLGVMVKVDVPLPPGAMVNVLADTPREKSGVPVLNTDANDHAALPVLEVGSRACTCQ
jgi:hypothetical protein